MKIPSFHSVHGSGITISEDGLVATRSGDFCNGVTFSAQPIKVGQKVCVELTHTAEWSGALRIGVTSYDPSTCSAKTLPRYVCPDLTNKDGYWARALSENYAETGSRVTFYFNPNGKSGCCAKRISFCLFLFLCFEIRGVPGHRFFQSGPAKLRQKMLEWICCVVFNFVGFCPISACRDNTGPGFCCRSDALLRQQGAQGDTVEPPADQQGSLGAFRHLWQHRRSQVRSTRCVVGLVSRGR